jgi:hypothetical protein
VLSAMLSMKKRPIEQIYMKTLRGSMRVMLVSRKNCSTYRNEARTHKYRLLASEPASAAWGTPHCGFCGSRISDIRAPRLPSPFSSLVGSDTCYHEGAFEASSVIFLHCRYSLFLVLQQRSCQVLSDRANGKYFLARSSPV